MKYKVGDKVRIKSLDWFDEHKDEYVYVGRKEYCGKVVTISKVFDNSYFVKEDNGDYYWTDEMIEGLVEEETEKKLSDESWRYKNIFDHSQYPQSFECPDGYQFVDENGNEILASKIILKKKKKEYPETYGECCKIMGINHTNDLDICEHCDYKTEITFYEDSLLEKIEALYRLIICRDAYWKIAGEEMGLDGPWESNDGCDEYGLYNVLRHTIINPGQFSFPTEQMRDAFKENFCKEL